MFVVHGQISAPETLESDQVLNGIGYTPALSPGKTSFLARAEPDETAPARTGTYLFLSMPNLDSTTFRPIQFWQPSCVLYRVSFSCSLRVLLAEGGFPVAERTLNSSVR